MRVRLKNIGNIITGNTPSTSDFRNYDSEDILFVKPSDISNLKIDYITTSENFISSYAKSKARILPIGSVLVTCIGIIGKVAIVGKECAINQQINGIIPDNSICFSEYLAYSIYKNRIILENIANAPVVPILNKKQFSEFEIDIPPLEMQKTIIQRLRSLDNLIDLHRNQLAKLDLLVKSRKVGEIAISEMEVAA